MEYVFVLTLFSFVFYIIVGSDVKTSMIFHFLHILILDMEKRVSVRENGQMEVNMKICSLFPPTAHRVSLRTDPVLNATIRNNTIKNLNVYKNCNPTEISERIRDLDLEWDTERFMQVKAASVVLLSSILGLKSNRCWFLVTGAVGVYLLQYTITGWCPLAPMIRKMGIRTAEEIHSERIALKILRGDFNEKHDNVVELLNIAEKQ